MMTAVAICAAVGAFAANVSGEPELYNISKVDNAYQATPVYSAAAHNLSEAGWYAGLKLTWTSNKQNASQTTASVNDNLVGLVVSSFTVGGSSGLSYVDKSPSGSGLANTFKTSWTTRYLDTTTWYFSVTPELMYECFKAEKDYEITLTIGDNTYMVTVPNDVELWEGDVKRYPAVGLLGAKVYGDAQLLANAVEPGNYQDVKFLVDPSELTFPDGFAAGDKVDGVWGVRMLHNHSWSFNVLDGTNLVATCDVANCPYNNGEVRMCLDVGTAEKEYDGQSVTRKAVFGEYFEDAFNEVSTSLTVNEVENGTINTAGVYTVELSVTGVGGDSEPYELSTTVTINKQDISGAVLVLTPASTTYNAAEQTVTPSVTVGGLAATLEVAEGSTIAATEIGAYSVTVNGTGNFTGTTSGTWEILNTTGALSGVAATVDDAAGSYTDGTLTVADTTALAYEDGAWTAGLTLTWPKDTKDWQNILDSSSHAYYVAEDSVKASTESGVIAHSVCQGSYRSARNTYPTFDYVSNTTWKVEFTPAVVEAAIAEDETALEYTMRAGAIASETYAQGVAFADYKIALSLENPITFVLGENETHDLGETVLTTTRIKLAPGASVTSSVAQTAEGAIFVDVPGYSIVSSEEGGVYTYTTLFTHQHAWSFGVVDGTNLVATCGNDDCDMGGEVRMWLHVDATEKVCDGQSMVRAARYDDNFKAVFPGVSAKVTVNGEEGPIKDAGTYTVVMNVTGLGDGETHTLSCTVTVSPVDITGATLVLTPASTTYNAAEQTVTPSVTVGGLAATLNNGLEVIEGICSATEIGTYSVTVNGTGNFTGTASGTWEIVNTTGSLSGVAATTNETAGNYEDGTLTVADTTALAYENGTWTAGLVLTWPMDKKDWQALSWTYHAYYVEEDSAKLTAENGVVENATDTSSYKTGAGSSQKKDFTYLATTTWTVPVTPAVVEAALAEEKSALTYTLNAGALVWGDDTEGDPDGVAFADYKIALSLENPITFVLGENETHDLGETVLTTTRIKLAPGASVTTTVQQTEGLIFIETPGYDVVWSENDGVYTYTTKFTHQHAWSFGVVDGTNLVATCGNDDCDMGGEVRMWLHVDATEKVYDGQSMTRAARYDDHFKAVFPGVSAKVTVNGEEGPIKDAGTYTVVMNVTGLGDGETHVLSTTVTVSPVDITGATLVLTPASTTYNAAEQTVTPSVTVDGLVATIEVAEGTTTAATEIGEYTVTVNGTGNFTGTTSAKWEIVNTTGEPTSVAASAAGSMTNVGNDFTLSDSSKLEYNSENKVWYAGITITWPMEKQDFLQVIVVLRQGSANYVKEDSARITTEDGIITNVLVASSYKTGSNSSKDFTYLSTTTWKVPLTPAIIEAAIAEEKSALTYTMNAGALIWGDDTEGDKDGVAFRDYTITIPLEGIKLYDENGHQVYPAQSEQDIVEEMKGAIDAVEGLDEGGKSAAKAKVDALVEAADGDANEVRDWIEEKTVGNYGALADSDYIVASYVLDTEDLITDESEVEVVGFETTDGGFSFAVKVDDGDVESARVKAAGIVQSAASLEDGEFAPIDAERVVVDEGKITIAKDAAADREFFKIVIRKDSAE